MEFQKENNLSAYQNYLVHIPTGGQALLVATDANHIHFDANHHSAGPAPDRCWIVCRGIEYGASLHFKRIDGVWTLMSHPHVTRCGTFKDASPAARKWIQETALAIAEEFARCHAAVLGAAENDSVKRELDSKRAELEQAVLAVRQLETRIAQLTQELNA